MVKLLYAIATVFLSSSLLASNIQSINEIEKELNYYPKILIGVAQIYLYFSNENFKQKCKTSYKSISNENKLFIYGETNNLLKNEKKDSFLKTFKSFLEKIKISQKNTAFDFILQGEELLEKALLIEEEAMNRGNLILWRFSTGTKEGGKYFVDLPESAKERPSEQLSFANSLLGGFIKDGYLSSNINEGITNFSACTFCYWIVHRQGVEQEQKLRKIINKTNILYHKYLDTLSDHTIYALELTKDDIKNLGTSFYEGDLSPLLQTCLGSGENFHPNIKPIAQSHQTLLNLFSRVHIIYLYKRIISDQNDNLIKVIRENYKN